MVTSGKNQGLCFEVAFKSIYPIKRAKFLNSNVTHERSMTSVISRPVLLKQFISLFIQGTLVTDPGLA